MYNDVYYCTVCQCSIQTTCSCFEMSFFPSPWLPEVFFATRSRCNAGQTLSEQLTSAEKLWCLNHIQPFVGWKFETKQNNYMCTYTYINIIIHTVFDFVGRIRQDFPTIKTGSVFPRPRTVWWKVSCGWPSSGENMVQNPFFHHTVTQLIYSLD